MFPQQPTQNEPVSEDTVTFSYELPNDPLYWAMWTWWVGFLADDSSWYKRLDGQSLTTEQQAAIWGEVIASEARS